MGFYTTFERLCNEKGVTLAQVREDLGIKQSTMASWKSRGLTPKAQTVRKLADYLGVSIACLLGVEEERAQMPSLNVGDTYFDGAVRVTRSDVSEDHATIVFEVDDKKMSVDEIRDLLSVLEKMSSRSGVSIEGLALLAEAASKAVQPRQPTPKPQQEGKDTTPTENPPDAQQNPPAGAENK